jgi:uncharacterized protein YcbX
VAEVVGTVSELWRFPVKSLLGEQVPRVELDARGVVGDRWWCVRGADGRFGSGKTTRRFRRMPGLLTMRSFLDGTDAVVELPDGWRGAVGDPETARRVADVVGEPIELATEGEVRHHDDSPVHLLTDSSLAWLAARLPDAQVDRRRFRPNVVVTTGADPGLVEESWAGRTLSIGTVQLAVTAPAIRCVMASQAQEELAFVPTIVGELERSNDLNLGVYATVVTPGSIAVGDDVVLS